ncbi:MAG TPA: DUF3313 domain-containing protein [Phycisphaerae bacterium]|nr:DUF3313 domain-containing protein [Phycisphaerae bacterium]
MATGLRIVATVLMMTGVAAVFPGCSHPEESGFLVNYNGFKETGLLHKNLIYVNDGVDFTQYNAVKILPVRTYLMSTTDGVAPAEIDQLTDFFQQQLVDQFAVYFRETNRSAQGVVIVRAAVTSLVPTDVAENAAAQGAGFIPGVGLVVSAGEAAYKGVTHDTLGMGQASFEVEFLDAVTGQRIFGYVGMKEGSSLDIKGQATRWGVVETIMKKWATFLAVKLKKLSDPSFDEGMVKKIEQQL